MKDYSEMTREESIKKYVRVGEVNNNIIKNVINEIYDDFESRTCKNCKFNKKEDGFMIFCDAVVYRDGSKMMWHSYTNNFSCNKWEQSERRKG